MYILHWSTAKQGPLTCLLFLPKPCFWKFRSSPGITRGTQLYLGALDRLWVVKSPMAYWEGLKIMILDSP